MDGLLVPVPFPVQAWAFRTSDVMKREVYKFQCDGGRWRLVYVGKLDVADMVEKLGQQPGEAT